MKWNQMISSSVDMYNNYLHGCAAKKDPKKPQQTLNINVLVHLINIEILLIFLMLLLNSNSNCNTKTFLIETVMAYSYNKMSKKNVLWNFVIIYDSVCFLQKTKGENVRHIWGINPNLTIFPLHAFFKCSIYSTWVIFKVSRLNFLTLLS